MRVPFNLGNAGWDATVEGGERRTFEGWQGLNVGRLKRRASPGGARSCYTAGIEEGLKGKEVATSRLRRDKCRRRSIEEGMTVTLKLKPEVEAGLLKQAKASGKTLEEYPALDGGRSCPLEGAGEFVGRGEFVCAGAGGGV